MIFSSKFEFPKWKNSNFLSNIVKNSPKTINYKIVYHSTIFLIHAIEKFQMKKISRDSNHVIQPITRLRHNTQVFWLPSLYAFLISSFHLLPRRPRIGVHYLDPWRIVPSMLRNLDFHQYLDRNMILMIVPKKEIMF